LRRRRVRREREPRLAAVRRHRRAPADERVHLVGGERAVGDPRRELLDRQRDERLARVDVEDDVRRAAGTYASGSDRALAPRVRRPRAAAARATTTAADERDAAASSGARRRAPTPR
jgi:hypothetical protein